MLVNSGVKEVVYDEAYRIPLDPDMIAKCGVVFRQVKLGEGK
jgi:deoxycytidylate deaminase